MGRQRKPNGHDKDTIPTVLNGTSRRMARSGQKKAHQQTKVYGTQINCQLCRRKLGPCGACSVAKDMAPTIFKAARELLFLHSLDVHGLCDLKLAGECTCFPDPDDENDILNDVVKPTQ